jgi:hypothetical protein
MTEAKLGAAGPWWKRYNRVRRGRHLTVGFVNTGIRCRWGYQRATCPRGCTVPVGAAGLRVAPSQQAHSGAW